MSQFTLTSARFLALTLLGVVTLGTSACTNTLEGAGQDIERAGQRVQETAR